MVQAVETTPASARSAAPAPDGAGPILSAAAPLPGDTALLPAFGKQERPQIAKGAETSLAVWADTRSALSGNGTISVGGGGPYFGPGLGTMNDIYAARLDQNGNVIDGNPIVVSQGSYSQNHPRVAWNGENWLIAWIEEVEMDRYAYQIRAARVSPAGLVLDATPMVIASASFGDFPTRVTIDGSNWVIVWDRASQTTRSVQAARVSPAGFVLDPNGITIYDHPSQYLDNPDLAFNGSGFLLTFRDMGSAQKIYGLRLTQTLQPSGGIFPINNFSPSKPTHVRVASNGDGYFLAWDEHPASGNIGGLYGARVSSTGQVLDPSGIVIDANVGTSETEPDVAWNGTAWSVAYNSGYDQASGTYDNQDIYLRGVSTAGAILNSTPLKLSVASNPQLSPAISPTGNGAVQVVWHDLRAEEDIYTAHVSAAGAVSNERPVSVGAPRQARPRMAFGGNVFLSVFHRSTSASGEVFGQRLDANGNALDAEPFRISAPERPSAGNGSVAFNGTHFLVVWDEPFRDEFGNNIQKVYGRRVSTTGAFIDAAPFFIMDGLTPDVAALGDTFLTTAIRRIGSQLRYVEAVRVSAAGAVLGTPALVTTGFNFAPRVAVLGNRWLVVYEYHSRHDNSRSTTRAAFVDTAGTPAADFQVAASDSQFGTGNTYDDTPHLAVAGDEALIVWADNDDNQNNIKGRRIMADGTLLGSNFAFVICGATGSQFVPAVAWDGTNYVVTWLDQRDEQYPIQPRGDIYATRVAPDQTIVDGDGFPVANTSAPEETPFVVSANGTTIFAYSAFHHQAPLSAMRITIRRSFSSASAGVTAVSRKMHGEMGAGDVDLPLTGTGGIEPRSGGASGSHQIVVSFPAPVSVSQAQITSGVGSVMNMSVNGSQVIVDLAGFGNAQRLTLTLVGVNGAGDVAIPVGVLLGDTNGNGVVNATDVALTRSMSGQQVDNTNFKADVTVSGSINASDTGLVKAQSGTFLP